MAINFPNSPNLYDVYTDPVSKNSYVWTGDYWTGFTSTTSYQVSFNIASIVVEDDSSPVGVVSTLDFADNLGVVFSAGVATVTGSGGIATEFSTTSSINTTGIITAASFGGSGASLTGLTGASSGVYGDGDYVPQITVDSTGKIVGISTVAITASGGGGGESYWVSTSAGIHTLSNVGIGTTNPTEKLTVGGVIGFGPGNNVRIGDNTTGANLTSGTHNFFAGVGAGNSTTYGRYNNFFGFKAGHRNDGEHNNFLGSYAGRNNTEGWDNNFLGRYTGVGWNAPNVGNSNNFLGRSSGAYNTTGSYNNFFGSYVGNQNTTGSHNNFFGTYSGNYNTTGSHNIAIGQRASSRNRTGSSNISFGHESGKLNLSGNKNIFLGSYTGVTTSASYKVIIGHGFGITRRFDSPDAANDVNTPAGKDYQLAIGVRTDSNAFSSKYWIVGNENFNIGIGTTVATSKLSVGGDVNISGVITASSFVGDGSGLTGVIGSGSGVIVQDSGSIVGTAGTIDFGDNLTVSPISAGVVTVTASSSNPIGINTAETSTFNHLNATTLNVSGVATASSFSGNGINLSGIVTSITPGSGISVNQSNGNVTVSSTISISPTQWITTSSGIHTTSNVGVGTTNPQTPLQVERYGVKTGFGTFSAVSGLSTSIDSFAISSTDFKTAEYTLHVGFGSYIQAQKVLLMQNGTTAFVQEYAVMGDPDIIVSAQASISGGVCSLQLVPEVGVTGIVTYRYYRSTLL